MAKTQAKADQDKTDKAAETGDDKNVVDAKTSAAEAETTNAETVEISIDTLRAVAKILPLDPNRARLADAETRTAVAEIRRILSTAE
ncbi:hypothetical protein HW532_15785 [Kaustia mangrovi]|uniref:Uncharacterized protein n=1 Tax=Kaustia mangrovi TaxID=2593653 RepID=A0A7S8HD74_9HYPH|nr:hypothetical protein [Kaustia mangrovi]QPC44023.1 hypothetical protein HW532_15785 [Kaustia mangrovi]